MRLLPISLFVKRLPRPVETLACLAFCVVPVFAQTRPKPVLDVNALSERALTFAEQGRCAEALPLFTQTLPKLTNDQAVYRTGMGQARCAMALNDTPSALSALLLLKKRFPNDAQVMFVSVHYFSQLAMNTARELAAKAPTSVQARRLEAEAFESAGKWDEAIGTYRGILRDAPKEPGVHYRIGQALISKAGSAQPPDEARTEFEQEIAINPRDAASLFVLGELARRAGRLDEAAARFSTAAKSDVGFSEAYMAWGISLAAAGKYSEALAPLETYVKMQPEDPAGHYQLAIAYRRTGNTAGAARELALQKETESKRRMEQSDGHVYERTVR